MLAPPPPWVRLGLTGVLAGVSSLLFGFVYLQLWLVLRYGHKQLSFQTCFLFLLWAGLRALLFSYFRDASAATSLHLLAALLLPRLPALLHPQPHEPLLCTGERSSWDWCWDWGWCWDRYWCWG